MDGRLAQQFRSVAAKRLAAVEVAAAKISRQHEFNAEQSMIRMLGEIDRKFDSDYIYFGDAVGPTPYVKDEGLTLSYYDSRKNVKTRPAEFRMYYPANSLAMQQAWPGDWLWVCQRHDGNLLVIIAQSGHAAARRLDRLFGTDLRDVETPDDRKPALFDIVDPASGDDSDLDLEDADILLTIGVAPRIENLGQLEKMIAKFHGRYPLPPTRAFTAFARSVSHSVSLEADPDTVLFDWVSTTNDLYFAYERHVLQPELDRQFANQEHIDVDKFFAAATKYKNGRFSRAGASFEHHIGALLQGLGIRFWKPKTMKDGSKPDFLFPTPGSYGDADMTEFLTFLAAKTTTKERWRQIVTEATLIPVRHLITLDRELNGDVLKAMAENSVVPVIPAPIAQGYETALRDKIWSVGDFVHLVREREERAVTAGMIPGVSRPFV